MTRRETLGTITSPLFEHIEQLSNEEPERPRLGYRTLRERSHTSCQEALARGGTRKHFRGGVLLRDLRTQIYEVSNTKGCYISGLAVERHLEKKGDQVSQTSIRLEEGVRTSRVEGTLRKDS